MLNLARFYEETSLIFIFYCACIDFPYELVQKYIYHIVGKFGSDTTWQQWMDEDIGDKKFGK